MTYSYHSMVSSRRSTQVDVDEMKGWDGKIQQLLACKEGCSAGRLISCLGKLNSRRQRGSGSRRRCPASEPTSATSNDLSRAFGPFWRREATRQQAWSSTDRSTRMKDVDADPCFQFTAPRQRHRARLDYSNRRRVIAHRYTTLRWQLKVTRSPEMPGLSGTLTWIM